MTGSKPDIFHTPLLTPFASRLIHICVDLREIRTSDAHPKIPQNPCGRRDTEACTHLRGQPQNPREGRAACTDRSTHKAHGLVPWAFFTGGEGLSHGAPGKTTASCRGEEERQNERALPPAAGRGIWRPRRRSPPAPAAPAAPDMGDRRSRACRHALEGPQPAASHSLRSHACRLSSVFSEAHVPGKNKTSFDSVVCGRRNSARLLHKTRGTSTTFLTGSKPTAPCRGLFCGLRA